MKRITKIRAILVVALTMVAVAAWAMQATIYNQSAVYYTSHDDNDYATWSVVFELSPGYTAKTWCTCVVTYDTYDHKESGPISGVIPYYVSGCYGPIVKAFDGYAYCKTNPPENWLHATYQYKVYAYIYSGGTPVIQSTTYINPVQQVWMGVGR